jgi:hypothetical protein
MNHDRVHARRPHDPDNWRVGVIRRVHERDGHAVFTVVPVTDESAGDDGRDGDAAAVDLVVTVAVRDLVVRRLDADDPIGQRVWVRKRGESV